METPTTFWTLTAGGVEQSFDSLSLERGKLARRSIEIDELTITCAGQPYDTPDLWDYAEGIIIQRDRESSDGVNFSGGSIYFQGYMTASRRNSRGMAENVDYTISGPWWWLTQDCYEQFIPAIGGWTTHVILNLNATTGAFISLSSQLTSILTDALTKYGAIFTFDPTTYPEFGSFFPPSDEKRDLTHAQALKDEFKWSPRTVVWFDYTQTPPALHCNSATTLPTTTLNLGDGVTVSSLDIVPRYDQQVAQCIFRYEQMNTIGNQTVLLIATDTYPATTAKIGAMRASLNLYGLKGTEQKAILTCRDVTVAPLSNSFWFEKHQWLATAGLKNLVIHDVSYADPTTHGTVVPLQYEIQEGVFHNWMTVGGASSGAIGLEQDVIVLALADYTDEYGTITQNEEIQCKVKTTNLTSGTYTRQKITSLPEPIPFGLAQYFYNLLSFLPWEGEVSIELEEISATQFLGQRLNLTNGLAAWSTMNATVVGITEDLDAGTTEIKFGANKWLSPEEIIDLLKVTADRQYTFYATTMTTGSTPNEDVLSPDNTGKENSTRGSRKINKHIVQYTPTPTTGLPNPPTLTTTLDSINGVLTMISTDPTQGQVSISLQDLLTNDALN